MQSATIARSSNASSRPGVLRLKVKNEHESERSRRCRIVVALLATIDETSTTIMSLAYGSCVTDVDRTRMRDGGRERRWILRCVFYAKPSSSKCATVFAFEWPLFYSQ
ncbi:hypothetical protein JI435_415820 [Parastagonospora nodorum SN15]|uniref:Uncharacterized protein n=1 Tax=Phaeosphaeria nodorum (strain SN15 / ATCC MYA-4574 / FGSC 10173) TaxID=321614 RepID=A0A7U2I657_PHANO|nr:hypothetical protein JI435_415820 [Parastagonospora nodorum SN15]